MGVCVGGGWGLTMSVGGLSSAQTNNTLTSGTRGTSLGGRRPWCSLCSPHLRPLS